jgi:hypothetical protein
LSYKKGRKMVDNKKEQKMSHRYIMNNIIIEFIPILLLFVLVSYTDKIVQFSNSVLGKLAAMLIIILYSTIDTIHGLSVCLIFILYYMSDYVENMLNREGLEGNTAAPTKTSSAPTTAAPTTAAKTSSAPTTAAPTTAAKTSSAPTTAAPTTAAKTSSAPTTAAPTTAAPTTAAKTSSAPTTAAPTTATKTSSEPTKPSERATPTKPSERDKPESFENLIDAYGKPPAYNKNNKAAKEMFRKEYCEKGHLIYKGQVVKSEMSEHIFPEIKLNHEKCNLCDPACDFSIKEQQMRIENDLIKPKSSNDWFEYMKTMFS